MFSSFSSLFRNKGELSSIERLFFGDQFRILFFLNKLLLLLKMMILKPDSFDKEKLCFLFKKSKR